MTYRKKLRRIVTCQGGIQLVAALAALGTRETEQKTSGAHYEYEDFLVIYDLLAPPEQLEDFARVVKKMAMAVHEWRTIVYITKDQMDDIEAAFISSSTDNVLDRIQELVGAGMADEIFLCRNWQFGNRLMINAYRSAQKICYGDSIGIYFSEAYFLPAVANDGKTSKSLREKLRCLKISVKARIALPQVFHRKTTLRELNFDIGYFLLPDILGQAPPMTTRLVKKELMYEIFRQLAEALGPDDIRNRYKHIANASTVFLMTSNFSEASRMPAESELSAYREFLKRQNFPNESKLVIKPHPRDGEEKIKQLGQTLRDLFSDVILLAEPELFFIPFEIFLLQAFKGENEKATLRSLKIVTFSTACLSLEAVFTLKPIIGFGSELVSRFFYENYVSSRISHERDLHLALQKIAQAD